MNDSHTTTQSPSPMTPHPLDSLDDSGNGVRLHFCWQGDRFMHFIEEIQRGVTTGNSLCSIESDAEEYWPTSPPIQQLSLETIGVTPTVLGVGATGAGHWSISAQPATVDNKIGIVFDVALKLSMPLSQCGSQYGNRNSQTPERAIPFDSFVIVPMTKIAPTLANTEASCWTIKPEIESVGSNLGQPQKTLRWAYFISRKQ